MRRTLLTLVAAGALLFAGNSAYAGDGWGHGRGGNRNHHHHGGHGGYYGRGYNDRWFSPPPRFSVGYGYPVYSGYRGGYYRPYYGSRYGYNRGLTINFGF